MQFFKNREIKARQLAIGKQVELALDTEITSDALKLFSSYLKEYKEGMLDILGLTQPEETDEIKDADKVQDETIKQENEQSTETSAELEELTQQPLDDETNNNDFDAAFSNLPEGVINPSEVLQELIDAVNAPLPLEIPTSADVSAYLEANHLTNVRVGAFMRYYNAIDWKDEDGNYIDWQTKCEEWNENLKTDKQKTQTIEIEQPKSQTAALVPTSTFQPKEQLKPQIEPKPQLVKQSKSQDDLILQSPVTNSVNLIAFIHTNCNTSMKIGSYSYLIYNPKTNDITEGSSKLPNVGNANKVRVLSVLAVLKEIASKPPQCITFVVDEDDDDYICKLLNYQLSKMVQRNFRTTYGDIYAHTKEWKEIHKLKTQGGYKMDGRNRVLDKEADLNKRCIANLPTLAQDFPKPPDNRPTFDEEVREPLPLGNFK